MAFPKIKKFRFFLKNAFKTRISPAGCDFPLETRLGLWLGHSKSTQTHASLQSRVQIPLKPTRLFRRSLKGILDRAFSSAELAAAVSLPPSANRGGGLGCCLISAQDFYPGLCTLPLRVSKFFPPLDPKTQTCVIPAALGMFSSSFCFTRGVGRTGFNLIFVREAEPERFSPHCPGFPATASPSHRMCSQMGMAGVWACPAQSNFHKIG